MDARLYNILRGGCTHTKSGPFDADEWPLDIGELMWRGLVEPALCYEPDIVTAHGRLGFLVTQRGRDVFKAEEKARK